MNLAGNGKCAKNWNLNTNVTALQQHGCTRAYAASFSIHLCSCTSQCKVFHSEKKKQKPTKRRTKRFWIREYLKKTGEIWSVPHTVFRVKPIRSDREYFFRYIRMSPKRNRRYPRSSGMDRDKSGESGAFLFSRRVPDFCDGRRSFPRNENSNLYRRGRRRWISLITNPQNCWAPVPLSQINMASLENPGQTSGDYPIYRQNLGWSAKSKIPYRLGFSRHMKTRD